MPSLVLRRLISFRIFISSFHLFVQELSSSKIDRKTGFISQFSFIRLLYGNSVVFIQTKRIWENKHRIVAQTKTYVDIVFGFNFCRVPLSVSFIVNKIILIDMAYVMAWP